MALFRLPFHVKNIGFGICLFFEHPDRLLQLMNQLIYSIVADWTDRRNTRTSAGQLTEQATFFSPRESRDAKQKSHLSIAPFSSLKYLALYGQATMHILQPIHFLLSIMTIPLSCPYKSPGRDMHEHRGIIALVAEYRNKFPFLPYGLRCFFFQNHAFASHSPAQNWWPRNLLHSGGNQCTDPHGSPCCNAVYKGYFSL